MGKVTGFLEYDRQEQKYQLAGDRIRHFRGVHAAARGA